MNRLTLKALLLSVITEIKFGQPLAPNAKFAKKEFKKMVGLKPSATNMDVLKEMKRTYEENEILPEFIGTLIKFKIEIV